MEALTPRWVPKAFHLDTGEAAVACVGDGMAVAYDKAARWKKGGDSSPPFVLQVLLADYSAGWRQGAGKYLKFAAAASVPQ